MNKYIIETDNDNVFGATLIKGIISILELLGYAIPM